MESTPRERGVAARGSLRTSPEETVDLGGGGFARVRPRFSARFDLETIALDRLAPSSSRGSTWGFVMARVLVIDDDTSGFSTLALLLKFAGHDFIGADCGRGGIALATSSEPDVAVIDLQLPDICGLQVLNEIRNSSPRTACVMLSGFLGPETDFHASVLGLRVVSKPCFGDDLVRIIDDIVTRTTERHDAGTHVALTPHAAQRVASSGVKLLASCEDQPSLGDFCRFIGVARGTFRNWCATAGLRPKSVRDFLRALRAVRLTEDDPDLRHHLGNVLEMADNRTIAKFCRKAGGTGGLSARLPATVEDFLQLQTFVEDPEFVAAVRVALNASPSQTAHDEDAADSTADGGAGGGPQGGAEPA